MVATVNAQMKTDAYTKCRGAGHIGADCRWAATARQGRMTGYEAQIMGAAS
jgi:hypothetical protein